MISNDMADFLVHVIDIETAILENDMEKAKKLCGVINAMELDDIQTRQVNDSITTGIYGLDKATNETTRYLVENVECVIDREELLKQLDVTEAISSTAKEKGSELLDKVVKSGMFDGDYNYYRYARSLITLARKTGRYDKMDEIREYLEEAK